MNVKPHNKHLKNTALFLLVAGLLVATGLMQSWNSALLILNMGLVSAIMALGVNLQWGLAGLFNIGVMGFVALGGLAVALVSTELRPAAWAAGGPGSSAKQRWACVRITWPSPRSASPRSSWPCSETKTGSRAASRT